jgi:metal-responsive CopG/Arc/MetJ family transcriptional regulator
MPRKKDPNSLRSKGLARHKHPRIVVHLEQKTLDAIERYCQAQRLVPDRSQVVRLAVKEFLDKEGFAAPS